MDWTALTPSLLGLSSVELDASSFRMTTQVRE